jgi:aromatic-amino-acid transaminase
MQKAARPIKTKESCCCGDIAYIDFARKSCRNFMTKFGGLPENILTLFAFSASKSFTMYGLRNGALFMLSADEAIAEECYYSCAFSNRATWSNGSRGAMQVVSNIFSSEARIAQFEKERDIYRDLLRRRGDAFLSAARAENLPVTNYPDGFFGSVKCKDPHALCERLIKDNLFTVPLHNGIRLALCAISETKSALAPKLIRKALDQLK